MTAPNGPILFNNSTGSDTQSSGLGPSTAVYGTGASTTAASAVVTGINTTGVSAGDLLWVQSSSGRQFSIIASVDSSTQVTCDDVLANTESSRTWAIGGKRATWDNTDSRRLFAEDCKSGFVLETETNQSLTSTITLNHGIGGTNAGVTIRGSSAHKVIDQTASDKIFLTANWNGGKNTFRYLKFTNSNASKSNAHAFQIQNNTDTYTFINCIFGDATNSLRYGLYCLGWSRTVVHQCLFTDSEIGYYAYWNPSGNSSFTESVVRNMSGDGYYQSSGEQNTVVNSVFYNCGGYGVRITGEGQVIGCICLGNTSGGIYLSPSYGNESTMASRNILVSNGGYGIHSITNGTYGDLDNILENAYFNNTSGQTLNANVDPITLTADPFVDAANGDFNLNATNGGGGTLRSTNYTLGG